MRRNLFSLLLVCMMVISMPMMILTNSGSSNSKSPYTMIPKASGIEGAIPLVGSQLYYRVITEESEGIETSIARLTVTAKESIGFTYNMAKYTQIDETTWSWIDEKVIFENYTYTLYGHMYTIDHTIPSMVDVNASENIDALFLADMNSTGMIYSTYSDNLATWHSIEFYCFQNDNTSTPAKIIWWADKTTGLVTYFEQHMENRFSKVELIGFEIDGSTYQQPDEFGLHNGDTIDYFQPSMDSSSSEKGEEVESYNDDRYDYYGENDQYGSASQLKNYAAFWYPDLVNQDDDYYKLYLYNGQSIQINAYFPSGHYFYLQQIDPYTGSVLGNEDGSYDDGYLQISITATSENWYCFRIVGSNSGDWYTLGIAFSDWMFNWEDWFEENDEYYTASYVEPWIWQHYGGLVQMDNDYYRFHLNEGQNVKITLYTATYASLTLQDIHPTEGYIIQADSSTDNGELSLEIHASAAGDFIIAVVGNNSGEQYNLEFYLSDESKSSEDSSMWMRTTVKFVYYNPYLDISGILVGQDIYTSPEMNSEGLIRSQGFSLNMWSYVNHTNLNAVYGQFFYKYLNWGSVEFDESMRAILSRYPEGPGLTITTFSVGTDWVEVSGTDHNGFATTMFVQQLKNSAENIGTIRYMSMISKNLTTNEMHKQYTMVIDCSAGGMISSSSELGVQEGDSWTYLVEEHRYEYKWESGESSSYNYGEDLLHYVNFTITHIFAGNRTVMAVLGRMEVWSSDDPIPKLKGFQPLLVWDTTDPTSFMNMGGYTDRIEGPPVLLPEGVDWTTQATAMNNRLSQIFEEGTFRTNYQPQAIRIHAIERYNDVDESKYREETIILESHTNGVVTRLTRNANEQYHYSDGIYSSEYRHEERFDAYLIDAFFASSTVTPSDYTNLVPGNIFVWEQSRYRPYEEDNNPAHKGHYKVVLSSVISSYDGAVVFIGSRFWKDWDSSTYHANTWHYWDWENNQNIDTGINQWLLGSIRPGNLWSWVQSQFYERTIIDFTPYKSVIANILNVMLQLPQGIVITSSNIETNATSFKASVMANEGGIDITYVMWWAMNDQGVMQDMFQGAQYTDNGTWRQWERQVLVECPGTTQLGEYFFENIPSNYVPWEGTDTEPDTTTTSTITNPFDLEIPGYPPMIITIFALFGVIMIFRRIRKQY